MLTRLRLLAAQLGPQPGARDLAARCIDVADLEPEHGWLRLAQHSRRAGGARGTTVRRAFHAMTAQRWLRVEIIAAPPTGTAADTIAALPRYLARHGRSRVTPAVTTPVPPPALVGATTVSASEQRVRGASGGGRVLNLHFAVDDNVVVLCASGLRDDWAWPELTRVAERQVRRLASNRTADHRVS